MDPEAAASAEDRPAQPHATEHAASSPASASTLTPVKPGERILTLDVLRGIALFGVLAANIWLWFSGVTFRFPEYRDEVWRLSADAVAYHSIWFFISGKAITTFSLLFGIGFALQMTRAGARGRSIVRHHSRRLAVLLAIGAVHAFFIWYGDILMAYSVLGFALLLFRKRRERTLLAWAVSLVLILPVLFGSVILVMATVGTEAGPEPTAVLAEASERNTEILALFASAEPARVFEGNLRMLREQWLSPKSAMLVTLLGIFLLGLYVGRRRILEDPAAHRALLWRVVAFGFPIGIAGTTVGWLLTSIPPAEATALPWLPLAVMTSVALGTFPLAFAYIGAATLLLQHPAWRGPLSSFAPVGRMALTNYLAQSVLCVGIYYGGGLVGRAGPFFGLLLAVGVFALQMVWSAWWLARFRFGPMEWVWRSLTYGQVQPMRLSQPAAPAAEPA